MRGKVAKRLRRQAQKTVPGNPARSYVRNKSTGSLELAEGCVRQVYHELRKEHRHGQRRQ